MAGARDQRSGTTAMVDGGAIRKEEKPHFHRASNPGAVELNAARSSGVSKMVVSHRARQPTFRAVTAAPKNERPASLRAFSLLYLLAH